MNPKASVSATLDTTVGRCAISLEPLDTKKIIDSVGDDGAGAIAVFIGTTRNSFQGKVVTRLEYQAYSKLAIKTMAAIMEEVCNSVASQNTSGIKPQIRCTVVHRIGVVPVGEPSIVIAVSSPHRKEAFKACESILEDVKKQAQIWKREYYEGIPDEQAEWKANT
ncbi:molybdenum cofactor synthesis 2 [Cylindrobasidium torrendii FP15055 ss-10]|uniref:Molybdenum cofactor synthesis 2 n=1 Tax=Cylindrobasidium torrendii FP15055 ss-10 TaxID=1314674 RepID=A0A0D7B253_9AGAR|nr:molybdenum cofactor synthesis 2 [Cylindrobasidium torrendii FP15055 ss-10]